MLSRRLGPDLGPFWQTLLFAIVDHISVYAYYDTTFHSLFR